MLLSVSKEQMPLLSTVIKIMLFAVSRVKFWFSGFDSSRFHNSFFFILRHFSHFFWLSLYHIIDSSHTSLLAFKIKHNVTYKNL